MAPLSTTLLLSLVLLTTAKFAAPILSKTRSSQTQPQVLNQQPSTSEAPFTITPQVYGQNDQYTRGRIESNGKCVVFQELRRGPRGEQIWWDVDMHLSLKICSDYCQSLFDENLANGQGANAGCLAVGERKWEQPLGRRRFASGDCFCNDDFINTIAEEFVNHAIPAIEEITCKTWYTAIDSVLQVGINALPGLGQAVGAAATVALQVAEVAAYTFDNDAAAADGFNAWLENPGTAMTDASSWSMDKVCGNRYTPADAQKIFTTFSTVAGAVSGRGLLSGAGKSWSPPPYPKGGGSKDEMMKYLQGSSRGNRPGDRGQRGPTTRRTDDTSSTSLVQESTESSEARNITAVMTTLLKSAMHSNATITQTALTSS